MKKYAFIIALFVVLSHPIFAQIEVATIKLNYKAKSFKNKESLAISNSKTGELVLLVEDRKNTSLYLLNEGNMEIKQTLVTERLQSDFRNFIGYQINNDGSYRIVFTDKFNARFGVLAFNFNENSVKQKELKFYFNKEKYVEGITHQDSFYLMTANKKNDDVNFYSLSTSDLFEKHTVSFKEISSSINGFKSTPYNILLGKGISKVSTLTKIDPNSPNAIETTAKKNKLYQVEDKLIFTIDHDPKNTKILTVSVPEFSVESTVFEKKNLSDVGTQSSFESFFKHNSFLFKNILYQISINSKKMYFSAKNFTDKTILKEINLEKDDPIDFKNGPIIQEGSTYGGTRKLEKTSKFLRKVSKGNTGISAYSFGEATQITIGSYLEVSGGAPMMMGGFGGATGVIAYSAAAMAFNPTYGAYGGYTSSKSTHIDCLFDEKFNQIPGDRKKNVFDYLKYYEDNFEEREVKKIEQTNPKNSYVGVYPSMKLKNVFFHNGKHYLSFINSHDKQYHIVEF